MSTTTTTIHLIYQGIPIDITAADLGNLAAIKAGLIEAKKLGFEGQPLRPAFSGGFGGKGGKPAPVAPVRNTKGDLCCPTHVSEKRSRLERKEWASGTVYACGCKGEDGQWCKYKLEAAQFEQFEASVPKAATSVAPASAAEAKQRFFARFGTALGGTTWADVQKFWGDDTLTEPTTAEAWMDEARELKRQLDRRAA